ncbi:MAG: Hsp70 family protein [Nitrospiraceae bacterium]|nr:Hsp70 family protein [Nitrospiraceae bacterium]
MQRTVGGPYRLGLLFRARFLPRRVLGEFLSTGCKQRREVVGGQTRMPKVQDRVKEFFGNRAGSA